MIAVSVVAGVASKVRIENGLGFSNVTVSDDLDKSSFGRVSYQSLI